MINGHFLEVLTVYLLSFPFGNQYYVSKYKIFDTIRICHSLQLTRCSSATSVVSAKRLRELFKNTCLSMMIVLSIVNLVTRHLLV